jgi:Tat protein translocase TatB subunit
MPTSLGPAEILVILVVALIVLGPNRLPGAARQVGKALAEVKRWSAGIQDEMRDVLNTEPEPAPHPEPKPSAEASASPPPPTPSTPAPEATDNGAERPTSG